MNITVNVQLLEGDVMEADSTEIAHSVLQAVGGDASKDFCQVTITNPAPPPVTVGTLPPPPPLPEE
jgi:hypothetical protein